MNRTLRAIAGATVAAMLALVGFAGGVWFDRSLGMALADRRTSATAADMKIDDAVVEVAGIIEELALRPSSEESMTVGAINGMLESLEDSHAVYFDEEHYKYFNEQNMGSFYGIGITISNRDDDLVINSVIEGSPAETAGLKPNDCIVEIDGETRPRWDVDEAVLRIRGEEGTSVELGVRREGEDEVLKFRITRAKIDVPNVESDLLEDGVGYVRLYSFNASAASDVRESVEKLTAEGARGFVLDLRNNPGGLLSSSVEVGSLFIPEGVIVTVEERSGEPERYRATGDAITDAPLVVLVNGNSASASEIVAGALQDHGRAILVGEKTFGKGSVQQIEELSFGGAVKLTVAHYMTPKGRAIDRIGLAPDVVVEMDHSLITDRDKDVQLQKAVEVLKKGL